MEAEGGRGGATKRRQDAQWEWMENGFVSLNIIVK